VTIFKKACTSASEVATLARMPVEDEIEPSSIESSTSTGTALLKVRRYSFYPKYIPAQNIGRKFSMAPERGRTAHNST
jgi:hypothetical protein